MRHLGKRSRSWKTNAKSIGSHDNSILPRGVINFQPCPDKSCILPAERQTPETEALVLALSLWPTVALYHPRGKSLVL